MDKLNAVIGPLILVCHIDLIPGTVFNSCNSFLGDSPLWEYLPLAMLNLYDYTASVNYEEVHTTHMNKLVVTLQLRDQLINDDIILREI